MRNELGTLSHNGERGRSNRDVYNFLSAIKDSSRFFLGVQPDSEFLKNEGASHSKVTAVNRSCGDSISLHLSLDSRMRLHYSGYFCAVCHASSEVMCTFLNEDLHHAGVSRLTHSLEVQSFIDSMTHLDDKIQREQVTSTFAVQPESIQTLRLLLQGLEPFALRFQCASLPWKALKDLMQLNSIQGVKKP